MEANRQSLTNPMAPLSRLLNSTLTVADIVSAPLWSVPATMPVEDAHKAMDIRSFDVGGVTPDPPRLYVHRSDLEQALDLGAGADPVDQHARNIPASECIEKSLPVANLLELFEKYERLFVLDGSMVKWVITHADLAAPAVSVSVLSYLIVIESGLKHLASNMSDEEIVKLLPPKRQQKVLGVHEEREGNNVGTTLRDCMYIEDWLTVTRKTAKLLNGLGFESGTALSEATSAFGKVRNDLAHGRDLLCEPGKAVSEVLARVRKIREFCSLVWREVEHSRPRWDAYADRVISTLDNPPTNVTGEHADSNWQYASPVFVLSAWNPGGVWVSAERNDLASRRLRESLKRRGGKITEVVITSIDRESKEEGFLIEGLQVGQVADLGVLFGQDVYFELDEHLLKVCDPSTMDAVRSVRRQKLS